MMQRAVRGASGVVRRRPAGVKARDVPLPAAILERVRTSDGTPRNPNDDRDGTLWTGYASGWIYDGRRGFYEHQPGFLKMRARC